MAELRLTPDAVSYTHLDVYKRQPIGVSTYRLSRTVPDNMKELLPEPEQIMERLKVFEE